MILQMTEKYPAAYVEILEIINYMGEKYKNKIPTELLRFFEENKDSNYKYEIKKLSTDTQFLDETLVILALIEQKYWASVEQRERLNKALKENERIYQKKLREKYNPDRIFQKDDSKDDIVKGEVAMQEYHESFFEKIKKWFRSIFSNET